MQRAVNESVREQAAAGLDIVSDGEMGKPSFITYAASRLEGLEKREGKRPSPFATSRETAAFPEYYQSEGVQFDPEAPVTLEMFDEAFPKLSDMTNAAPLGRNRARLEERLRAMGRIG